MRKKIAVFMLLLSVFSLTSCTENQNSKVITDLAYSSGAKRDNLVYLQEDGQFVPFIVAENNYGGNVLLVRKDVLPLPRKISDYDSYYENSSIDQYLNGEYLQTLSASKDICFSRIVVTEQSAIGASGDSIKKIERKVFLLSLSEIGITENYNSGIEGTALPYFRKPENRIAYYRERAASWWLRTPDTYYFSCTYGIGPDGTIGSGNAFDENGIRPAFCVSPEHLISESKDLLPGKDVFVLYPNTNQ